MKESMYYSNEDIKIYYKIIGEGKPILILHGFSIDHRGIMTTVEEAIKSEKYQRIYIDLPGMGNSPAPTTQFNADRLLEILIEFTNEIIGDQSFSILGYSYGGYLALGMAQKVPNLIDKLVLLAPTVKAKHSERCLPKKKYNIIEQFDIGNATIFEGYKMSAVNITEQGYQSYSEDIYPGLMSGDHNFQKSFQKEGYAFGMEKSLFVEKIICESLIILGKQDDVVGFKDLLEHQKTFPNSKFILLDYAGHNVQIDEPNKVIEEIKYFLR